MTRAIYVRTSHDDNDGAAQLDELGRMAAARGWPIDPPEMLATSRGGWVSKPGQDGVMLFLDRGESGAKASRPEWDALLDMVRRGQVSEVMATELSRIGRSVVNVVLALEELTNLGCVVIFTRQGELDYSSPVGRAVASILAAVAQLERDQTTERIRAGVRRSREHGSRSGRPHGRPRRVFDVEEARRLRLHGLKWRAVARAVGVSVATVKRALEGAPKT